MPPPTVIVWALRVAWIVQVAAAGPALDSALSGRSTPVTLTASVGLWAAWTVGLVATLVPTTVSLTAVRLVAAGPVAAAVAAGFAGASAGRTALAIAAAGIVFVLANSAEVGRAFVQGSAYGDEVRFPLRPPRSLLPVLPLLWAVAAAGVVAGPLLLAAGSVAGVVALIAGWPLAVVLARRLHRLSRRWLVVVPAGLVVHDDIALADTLLLRRPQIALVTLAPAGTTATDLTAGAAGLAVEIRLAATAPITPARLPRQPPAKAVPADAVLVSPSRPGAVLEECARRRFPVGGAS